MAKDLIKEVACPNCGTAQSHNIFRQIYLAKNPEIKQKILKENFFMWQCSKCGYFADMAYSCLFIDIKLKYAFLFVPVGNVGQIDVPVQLEGYSKRIVRSPAELKEKLIIFESGYNDIALELVKNILCATLLKKYNVTKLKALFSRQKDNNLEFALFLPGKQEPIYHTIPKEIYDESLGILKSINYPERDEFFQVNAKLASKLIKEFEES